MDESKSNDETSINDKSNLNDEPNVTKPIPFYVGDSEPCNATLSQMQVKPYEEDTEYNQIASYCSKLPSTEQLLSQKDLQQGTSSGKQKKDKRYERKGKFAKIVMNSPNGTRNYTIEKEWKHKDYEINKTLYGYYNNGTDDLPFIKVVELLRATIKHLTRNHIEAFYKTTNSRFVIVLSSEQLKGIYSHEVNFR